MLWDLIRDFFVEHVFGGFNTDGDEFGAFGGMLRYYENGEWVQDSATINSIYYKINDSADDLPYYLGLGDWLSTTATAIAITIIVVLCCMFVYKIVKLIGGLIR